MRSIVEFAGHGHVLHPRDHLILPRSTVAVQHIHDNEIVQAVTVDIGEIDPHGKHAGFSERQRGGLAKAALANVEPKTIFAVKIIANIQVRTPVTVDVPEHHGQPPLEQRPLQRRPACVYKPATADFVPLKPELAKVAVEHIRQPVFLNATARIQSETVFEF